MISLRLFKLSLWGGSAIGLGSAIFFFLAFQNELINPIVRFFDVWIALVVIVFFLIWIRSLRPSTEPFHFWEALICGNVMCFAGGIISGLLIWQVSLFYPVPFHNFIHSSLRFLAESEKAAPETMKMKNLDLVLAEMKQTVPSFMVWDEVKKKVLYSFLLVPLISMFMRRK